ncbi:S-layer protein [Candidatus Micrarchaeota archaeon]|nr:S-layer protein [Candidatus Micrarchaeota archaeon]
MKGLNVKKIAALAAGALFIGSAAVAAGVIFEDTQLVSDQGIPQATVIVGSNAMVSDGIAAGRIAAKLASESYKEMTYTATTAGAGTCTPVTTGNETAGTCPITDESVTLKITSPGISGVTTFKTLIHDYIDKDLENRYNDGSSDKYNCNTDDSDDASPFTEGSGTCSPDERKMHRIDGNDFTPFAQKTITDNQGGGTYKEEQYAWIKGDTEYDGTSAVVGKIDGFGYSVKFSDPYTGIPLCSDDQDGDNNWADCYSGGDVANDDYRTDNHRVEISFLGSDNWVITELSPPSGTLDSEDKLKEGGTVKLAKESNWGVLDIGDSLTSGNYKITLDDISTAVGSGNDHPAIISIYDTTTGEKLKQNQINPTETKKITLPTGDTLSIHVYETAPGYTLTSKWAEMAVYENEITINGDGGKITGTSDDTSNKKYKAYIYWKNKDADATANDIDTIRAITIWNDDTDVTLNEGDTYPMMAGGNLDAFQLTYEGLESADMDSLKFDMKDYSKGMDSLTICGSSSVTGGYDEMTGASTYGLSMDLSSADKISYVKVTTEKNNGFRIGGYSGDSLYYILDGYGENRAGAISSTGTTAGGDRYVCITNAGTAPSDDYYNGWRLWWDHDDDGDIESTEYYSVSDTEGTPSTDCAGGETELILSSTVSGVAGTGSFVLGPKAGDLFIYKDTNDCWMPVDDGTSTSDIEYKGAGNYVSGASGYGYMKFAIDAADYSATLATFDIYEDAGKWTDGTTTTDHAQDSIEFVGELSSGDWRFASATGVDDDKAKYGWTDGSTTSTEEEDFITERGSVFEDLGDERYYFSIAPKVLEAQYTYTNAGEEAEPNTKELIMHEGDTETIGDTTIEVESIDEEVGACTTTGTGAASCMYDEGSVTGAIQAPDGTTMSSLTAMTPGSVNPSTLIKLDKDAMNDAVFISVGGPAVNEVTARELTGANAIDFNTENVVTKQISQGKIIVAGLTAQDTLTAADQFIAQLQRTE